MQKCGNCGHENRAGVVFCENCGASLIGKQPLSTKALEVAPGNQGGDSATRSPLSAIVQEMAVFKPGDILKLSVEGTTKPIELQPKGEVILGRRDPATGTTPDVDLTPYAGYRMGVSRRHAAIRQGDDNTLNVWDLGSSNGTFLNGQRLNAHRPYPLRDGDELRLGQMVIRVNFKPAPVTVTESAPPPPVPLPSTRPLQPLPEASAPAAAPAVSPKPVTEIVSVSPAPVVVGQPPAEKSAPVAEQTSPATAEEPKPAVSVPEAPAAPAIAAPTAKPAAPPVPAAEQPASPAPPSVPAAAEQPATPAPPSAPVAAEQPAAAKPEAVEPARAEAPAQAAQTEPSTELTAPTPPQVDQDKAPAPPAVEQGSETEAGEDRTASSSES